MFCGRRKKIFKFSAMKKIAVLCLGTLQARSLYRKVIRFLRHGIKIKELAEEQAKSFYHLVDPSQQTDIQNNPNVINFVAQRRNAVVGFVSLVRILEGNTLYPGYWLFSLTVKTLYRGMGLGEDLVKEVIARARIEKAQELSLLVNEDNIRAIMLYRKLNFENKIVVSVEEILEKEKSKTGCKRILMSRKL